MQNKTEKMQGNVHSNSFSASVDDDGTFSTQSKSAIGHIKGIYLSLIRKDAVLEALPGQRLSRDP